MLKAQSEHAGPKLSTFYLETEKCGFTELVVLITLKLLGLTQKNKNLLESDLTAFKNT